MTRPTKSIILQNYTLEMMMLPLNSRAISKVVISTAGASENAETLPLTATGVNPADTSFTIKAGTSLSFGASNQRRHQVLFVQDVVFVDGSPDTITTSPKIARLMRDLPASSAEFILPAIAGSGGMTPLFGIQGFDLQSQETTVDTTNTQSGSGMESTMVRFDRTIAITGVTMQGDRALETIVKRIVFDTAYTNREIYAVATYPNGEKYEGAAKIMGYSSPGNQNEVAKYQFNLQFQGDTLLRTQAYYFA